MLGRLVPDYFPKIFGKSAQEPLDIEASRAGFEVLAKEINTTYDKKLDLDEIVYGYVKDNDTYTGRPHTDSKHIALSRSRTRRCVGQYEH